MVLSALPCTIQEPDFWPLHQVWFLGLGGYLHLTSLQLPGKKRMPVADLLRGFSFEGLEIVK